LNKSVSIRSAAVLAVASTLTLVGCDLFTSGEQYLERGEKLLAAGEYNEAMIELKNAQSAAPRDARVLLAIARNSLLGGTPEATARSLDEAAAAGADPVAVASTRAQLLLNDDDHTKLLALLDDPASPLGADAAKLFRAQALAGLDRCEEAIPMAREILSGNPESGAAHVAIAQCYARHGNPARGRAELLSPESSDAPGAMYMMLGRLQVLTAQQDQAVVSLHKAAELAPGELSWAQQAVLLSALADLQIGRDDQQGLRTTRDRMLRIAPQAVITELLSARLETLDGKSEEAVNRLRRLVGRTPELPAVHVLLASAYVERAQWEQALREAAWIESKIPSGKGPRLREQISGLSSLKPDTEEFWMRAAAIHNELGESQTARHALASALRITPGSVSAKLALASLELKAGRIDAAREIIEPLAAANPGDLRVRVIRADMLSAAGKFAAASAILDSVLVEKPSTAVAIAAHDVRMRGGLEQSNEPLEKYLRDQPRDLTVRAVFAEALRLQGDNRAAIAQYETLVAATPDNPAALNNLASLYYLEGDKRALAVARRANELAPQLAAIRDTYGWLLVESGAVAEGLVLLKQADAQAGLVEPEIRLHYAAALARQGQREEARRLLAQLKAENPEFPSESRASRLLASLSGLSAT
jgi:predicted Zn-dependent protease